ncbi:MAG: nucleotidyltransferase domain-containing protein [Planctomycetaceae bacterium]
MGVDEQTIREAVLLLKKAADPKRIILFGSHATGRAGEDSDVDFMVIEAAVPNVIAETVRLRRVLSPLRIPVDIIVVSEDYFNYWADTPGNLMFEAATDGKVLYDQAA